MRTSVEAPSRAVIETWMHLALDRARRALSIGEAPIGCVLLTPAGEVLGYGHNTVRSSGNPTLHAEINAFASASGRFGGSADLVMVSTLEPCVMCTGAAMQSGVATIVFGLPAPADSGSARVTPPTSPGASNPSIVGGIGAARSRALFVEWMAMHEGDSSRDEQRSFISQLLRLTTDEDTAALPASSTAEVDGTLDPT